MTATAKKVVAVLLVLCAALLVLLVVFGDQYKKTLALNKTEEPIPLTDRVMYYADGNKSDTDNIPAKDAKNYFGYNRYKEATEQTDVSTVDFIAKIDGTGNFFDSIYHDPALCAAVALYLDQLGLSGDNPILAPEQNLRVGERADAAHLRFLEHEDQWDAAIERIKAILTGEGVEISIQDLDDYQSAMYMLCDTLDGNKPAVIVRNTNNEGGHMLVFKVLLKDNNYVLVRFRLECGYQPIDIPHWPPPDTPTPTTTPTPTPEPKNPADDPQNRPGASDYDFWAPDPVNHDPDDSETPEPTSPDDDYVPPAPPTEEPDPTTAPSPTTAPDPTTAPTPTTEPGYTVEPPDDSGYDPLDPIADPTNPAKPTPVVENPDVDAPVDDYE